MRVDLVVSVWGDARFLDAACHMWRSWRSVYDGPTSLHVGTDRPFDMLGLDPASLGVVTHVAEPRRLERCRTRHLRWPLTPTNLPLDRLYLLTEADVAFLAPPPIPSGNYWHVATHGGGRCCRAAYAIMDGPTYLAYSSVARALAATLSDEDLRAMEDPLNPHVPSAFDRPGDLYSTPCSLDEKLMHEALVLCEADGVTHEEMPLWDWYGTWSRYAGARKGRRESHVDAARRLFPGEGAVHLVGGEGAYEEPTSRWDPSEESVFERV